MAGNGGNKLRSNKSGILRWDLVTFLVTFLFPELLKDMEIWDIFGSDILVCSLVLKVNLNSVLFAT